MTSTQYFIKEIVFADNLRQNSRQCCQLLNIGCLAFGSMFGPLLRRSILQGSASRTWNCLTNFTQLLWCKLKYLRELRLLLLGYEFWYPFYDAAYTQEALRLAFTVTVVRSEAKALGRRLQGGVL